MKLAKLPDRTPVKMSIVFTPGLAHRLREYAEFYAEIGFFVNEPLPWAKIALAIAIWNSVPFTYRFLIPNRNSGEEPVVCRQHSCCTGDSRFLTRLRRVRNDS